jgi:hypothetical protein
MLIGLTGRPGAGQDVAADYLATSDHRFALVTFDRPLRNMLRAGFNLTEEHFHPDLFLVALPGLKKSPAQMLHSLRWQWIRTNTAPDTLLDPVRDALADARARNVDVVIPDIYTDAEAALVREFGGQLLHLVNKHALDLGPDTGIKLRDLERELLVPARVFQLYDALDAIVGEEMFCEALA